MVRKAVKCPDCQTALTVKDIDGQEPSHWLILHKDQGGLTKPSQSVIDLCMATEKLFQKVLHVNKQLLPQGQGLPGAFANVVLGDLGGKVFLTLEPHMTDTEPDNNHVFALIKAITHAYCKIRMHHLTKQFNVYITGKCIRKKWTKLILFSHQ
jgi:hypothetical protein